MYNIHSARPSGTSTDRALRALRTSRPDLHEQVVAGTIKPHTAMLQAGLRKATVTIPRDIDGAVRALRTAFPGEQFQQLRAALTTVEH